MGYEYIDTRNTPQTYAHALTRFTTNPAVSMQNKEVVTRYLRDCALGKTVFGRSKKQIGAGQCLLVLAHLGHLMRHTGKDLGAITQADLEDFVLALEGGRITSRATRWVDQHTQRVAGTPLSLSYQRSVKVSIRKFYTWLHGDGRTVPPLVSWLDTRQPHVETPALTEAEVGTMIERARRPVERALIQVLYDGGFRIGEALNVRLHHVCLVRYDPTDPERACFFMRCPVSKTLPRTVALPMPATTKWLTYWLEDHPARPKVLSDGTLNADDVNAVLFPISADAARRVLHRLGARALAKRVYPHLLRHSSATYWANRLPHYRLCKRFGWSMTSSMPQHYIDQGGLDEYDTARGYAPTNTRASLAPVPALPGPDAAWRPPDASTLVWNVPANPHDATPDSMGLSRSAAYPAALAGRRAALEHAFPRGALRPPGVLVQPAPAPAWTPPVGVPPSMLTGQELLAAGTPVAPRRRARDPWDSSGDDAGQRRDDQSLAA
jgi:site-specific recombinase XerD